MADIANTRAAATQGPGQTMCALSALSTLCGWDAVSNFATGAVDLTLHFDEHLSRQHLPSMSSLSILTDAL